MNTTPRTMAHPGRSVVQERAEYTAWSAVHRLSSLLIDGPLRALPEPQVEQAIGIVLSGVLRSLT